MGAPSPTLSTVLTAANTAVAAASGVSNAVAYRPPKDNEWEFVKGYQNTSTGALSLACTFCEEVEAVEGPSTQEFYSIYRIVTKFYYIAVNDADWDADGGVIAEAIRTAIEGASAIFAISGQRQVISPETATTRRQGFEDIPNLMGQPQRIWSAEVVYGAEARRFS